MKIMKWLTGRGGDKAIAAAAEEPTVANPLMQLRRNSSAGRVIRNREIRPREIQIDTLRSLYTGPLARYTPTRQSESGMHRSFAKVCISTAGALVWLPGVAASCSLTYALPQLCATLLRAWTKSEVQKNGTLHIPTERPKVSESATEPVESGLFWA